MSNEQRPARSAAAIVAIILCAFVLTCGGLVLLFELFEGNLS